MSPSKLIRDLTAEDIETINGAMSGNMECRIVKHETATVLIYEPQAALEGCSIRLCESRTINDAWALATALWAATRKPND